MQKAVAKPGEAGFRIDLTAGTFAGLTQSAGLRIGDNADLQQAFVSYIAPLGSGLRFDAGKFVTHMGYELIEGYDGYNDNYSRSLLFNYAIPLAHTGIKASYSPSPRVGLMAMVVNGWDNAIDNNASKSIGAQLMLKPADPVSLYVNYIGGPENSDDNSSIRHVVDLIGTVVVNPNLSLGVNADFGTEGGTSAVTPGDGRQMERLRRLREDQHLGTILDRPARRDVQGRGRHAARHRRGAGQRVHDHPDLQVRQQLRRASRAPLRYVRLRAVLRRQGHRQEEPGDGRHQRALGVLTPGEKAACWGQQAVARQ